MCKLEKTKMKCMLLGKYKNLYGFRVYQINKKSEKKRHQEDFFLR